ncbi:FlgB family protein [Aliishimia ponticola]|uniref:FlgB family protein n=1 Tax=Aliishimia ponticola TaxID=2499833 RepID=A0A4S4NA58_9RHOB|nr:FlgB family protein [Aliishimia ponticola]THH35317.1 FlgB family protein [Aliishimia ponticola]
MFENLDVFKMSSAMASHAGRRQALTAQNAANVDTPGYRAKRLPSFADLTQSPDQHPALRATRAGHLYGVGAEVTHARVTEERNDPAPDGNTVSVEREMLESVSATREHSRALAIYKSALTILQTTLSRS